MKTIGNLSYRTDCIFHENNGSIEEKEAYYVIRTPSNPDFWFGNLLLFKAPPCEGCISVWMHAHHAEFADTLTHVTFGWDSEDPGAVSEFTKNGFKLESSAVLEMREYRAIRRTNPEIEVRRLTETSDWRAATELDIRTGLEGRFGDGYRDFKEKQMGGFRRMNAAGRGDWWGAFIRNELVGTLGLFFDRERRIGRFQNVATDSGHRRKGVCSTLLDHASRHAFEEVGVEELVIVTGDDETNPAKSVYRAAGFVECAKAFGMSRSKQEPESEAGADADQTAVSPVD